MTSTNYCAIAARTAVTMNSSSPQVLTNPSKLTFRTFYCSAKGGAPLVDR